MDASVTYAAIRPFHGGALVVLVIGSSVYQLALLFAAHFLADFPLQGEWMAVNKAKSNEVLVYHLCVYTAVFILLSVLPGTHITAEGLALNFVIHGIVDWLKCRQIIVNTIWKDQLLHLATVGGLHAIGWF